MKLTVKERLVTGKKVKLLRKEGWIPAIVYGKHLSAPVSVSLFKNDFLKIYRTKGIALPLELDGAINEMAIVKDYELDPISDELIHVDLLAVRKDQEVETYVPLVFIGESAVEKTKLGYLQYIKDDLTIKAKPADLPKDITVDVSSIETVNDVLFIRDIVLPKGVTVLEDLELPVVTVKSLSEMAAEEAAEDASGSGDAAGTAGVAAAAA